MIRLILTYVSISVFLGCQINTKSSNDLELLIIEEFTTSKFKIISKNNRNSKETETLNFKIIKKIDNFEFIKAIDSIYVISKSKEDYEIFENNDLRIYYGNNKKIQSYYFTIANKHNYLKVLDLIFQYFGLYEFAFDALKNDAGLGNCFNLNIPDELIEYTKIYGSDGKILKIPDGKMSFDPQSAINYGEYITIEYKTIFGKIYREVMKNPCIRN